MPRHRNGPVTTEELTERRCFVAHIPDALTQRIKTLENEIEATLEEMERKFQFRWAKGKGQVRTVGAR